VWAVFIPCVSTIILAANQMWTRGHDGLVLLPWSHERRKRRDRFLFFNLQLQYGAAQHRVTGEEAAPAGRTRRWPGLATRQSSAGRPRQAAATADGGGEVGLGSATVHQPGATALAGVIRTTMSEGHGGCCARRQGRAHSYAPWPATRRAAARRGRARLPSATARTMRRSADRGS
jgi:hypothetical protein